MTAFRAALVIVFTCIAMAGCGLLKRPAVELTFEDPVEVKLNAFSEDGGPPRPLRDLTDFDWDEVHVFYEGDAREEVEDIVGDLVFEDDYYGSSGSLLVFEKEGAVVKALAMSGEFVRGAGPSWPGDVLLEPYGLGYLRLVEPQ
ncbi:hypothetical protein [Mycobacterium deserti]|uniref:Lipoprotein n=1 Tax=Mycobacterium deserti TaxID=2978347 RepID=A0ABT2MAF2_9MYCO|nr:hypothetical protein [Mycobacterium deserti]MCT7658390.1 hypothetical protein [Mycobacterium deserti]